MADVADRGLDGLVSVEQWRGVCQLMEERLVAGDATLFKEMQRRYGAEVVEGTAPAFTEAKLAERETRVMRAGTSRYLVEPNVKDGKGGLRDLNTLFWIAKYAYRVDRSRVPAVSDAPETWSTTNP